MDALVQRFAGEIGTPADVASHLISTCITIVLLLVMRLIVVKIAGRQVKDPVRVYQLRRVSAWVFGVLGVLMVGRIWLVSFETLGTVLGLVSAGLAIALREPVANFFGWIYLLTRRPFELGDRVQVGDAQGDVVDLRVFDFSVMEVGNWFEADVRTGRVVRVPNASVFRSPVAVFQQGWYEEVWHEVHVTLTFESNWAAAKALFQEILEDEIGDLSPRIDQEMRTRSSMYFLLKDDHLQPQVLVQCEASGVRCTLRYLCEIGSRRRTEARLWERILVAIEAREDLTLAYPTQRILGATEPSNAGPSRARNPSQAQAGRS